MGKIIGFSGSPVANSNTDRLVKEVLKHTGHEYEFIKLSHLNMRPCLACKKCVEDNTCIVKDDFLEIAEKVKESDGIVIGAYTPFGLIDAFNKTLLERFFSLHHNGGLLKDKFLVSIVSAVSIDSQEVAHRAFAIESFIEKMKHIATLNITGTLPCNTCGIGDTCGTSGIKAVHGKDAVAGLHNCIAVEDQDVFAEGKVVGEKLGRLIDGEEEYIQLELTKKVIDRIMEITKN